MIKITRNVNDLLKEKKNTILLTQIFASFLKKYSTIQYLYFIIKSKTIFRIGIFFFLCTYFTLGLSKIPNIIFILAIAYIALLREILDHSDQMEPLSYIDRCFRGEIRTAQSAEWNTSDLTARLAWINWDNLGIEPGRRGVLANLQLSGNR